MAKPSSTESSDTVIIGFPLLIAILFLFISLLWLVL